LGTAYEKGIGVPKNLDRAVELYRKACDATKEFEHGCLSLGRLYLDGRGVTKDKPKAIELFRKACAAKEKPACDELKKLNEKP
jgi:uncharacterized protein